MLYPIPHKPSFGKDSTAYWEDFLSPEEIAFILSQPEWLGIHDGCVGGTEGSSVINKSIRSSKITWLYVRPELVPLWRKLSEVVSEVNRRYFHFDLTGFYEPIQLSIYTEGDQGHYDWHTDASFTDKNTPRKLSLSLLLSDPSEFEGGEFQVKIDRDEPTTLECKKGRAWFFPSYMLHRVAPVTKGVRRSLVLWVGGPEFR